MRIKMQGLKKGSSLEEYINDFDNLIRHVQLPEQQKICYFIFGLRFILKQVLLIPQSQSNMTMQLHLQNGNITLQIASLKLN